jgi:hypothetical protein
VSEPPHVEAVAAGIHPGVVSGADRAVAYRDLPRSYRTREQSIVAGISGLIGSSFLTLMGVAVAGAREGLIVGAVMGFAGVLGYLLTFRAARAGICLHEHGVVIMNLLRSTTIAWTELEQFSVGAHGV